jgi:hypothetical protein
MAKKVTKKKGSKPAKKTPVAIERVTQVRKTSIPPKAAASVTTQRTITGEAIARRAFEIYSSGHGGSAEQNWLRAENELRAGL